MPVQAVILAGGAGKRIHPLGINKPKAMFELMGKPLIQFVVENLREAGITDLEPYSYVENADLQLDGFLDE